MEQDYELDTEDEKILDELDDLFGVVQNKEVLRDVITYANLKKCGDIDFGNFNIIIRNESDYPLLEDFLKVCSKLFKKHRIITNDKICYWSKLENSRRLEDFEGKIQGISESIIVISPERYRRDFSEELDKWKKIISKYKKKIFIFEDTDYCEGDLDAKLGDLLTWRMTIDKISLDDKVMYCKNKFDKENISYKERDLKDYADVPLWVLKNMVLKVILDCKRKKLDFVDRQVLFKNKNNFNKNRREERRRRATYKKYENDKNAKEELNELVGLDDVKGQVQKVLNYIKLNKERGQMPCLHMCFTGNPRYRENKYCKNYWKTF